MKLASHLKRSPHGVYYFRITVPKPLRPLYAGVSEIKRSLKTRDPATARREAYILSAQIIHKFQREKRDVAQYDPSKFNPNDPSTFPKGKDGLTDLSIRRHADGSVEITTDPNIPDDHINALKAWDHLFGDLKNVPIEQVGMLKDVANTPAATSPAAQQPVAQAAPAPHTISLSQGIRQFMVIAGKDPNSVKTLLDMQRTFERFLSWTKDPHDPPIGNINKKLMVDYMTYLLTVEPNIRTKGLGLSKKTVEKHLIFLNVLFTHLQNTDLYPSNLALPTKGVSPFRKGEKKKAAKRQSYKAFVSDEITKIFDPTNIKSLKRPHEFWVPLLGLYTGARIREISQLRLKDIVKDGELWCFDITDEDETGTKNEPSVRRIPIHPDILALGFLDYVDDVRAVSPSGLLFPYLPESINGYGDQPSKSFSRYLKALGIKSREKVFHSFRSTLIGSMEGVPQVERYVGHALDDTSFVHYKNDLTPQQYQEFVVSKIRFPQVHDKIGDLKYQKGAFSAILQAGFAARERAKKLAVAREAKEARAATAAKAASNRRGS